MLSTILSKELRSHREHFLSQLPEFPHEKVKLFQLSYEDVVDVHFSIADFFYREDYGIGGIGFRDLGTFISTVERQYLCYLDSSKDLYPFEVISTLMFGIIKNHPFYDANKRTAFLCALYQLHRMGRSINIPEKEFENLMVEIASKEIEQRANVKHPSRNTQNSPIIGYLARYLQKNSRKNAKLRKTLKFRELRQVIQKNGFSVGSPRKGTIDIVKTEKISVQRWFRQDKIEKKNKVVGNIAYHGEGVDVPDSTLKRVREICGMTDQDGFDSDVIFRDIQPTFQLISSYRTALQNLAYR